LANHVKERPPSINLTDEDKNWINAQLDSKLERLETTLLTEFHKRESPAEARARTHAAVMRAVDLELESTYRKLRTVQKN
jgi:hypothetical protein